jgi:hypothetical protein
MTTTIQDAIKYGWTDQLAKDFFYEKCHGYPEDIMAEIEKLITGTVEAEQALAEERKLLENIPF